MPRSSSSAPRPSRPLQGSGELALIEHIRQRAANGSRRASALRLGIGDDCALIAPPRGHEIVLTTDMSLEGRHFRRDWHPAQAIGHRTLARGLSDLAAMGARPLAAFLSLALPRAVAADSAWMNGFLDGLLALATACQSPLAGGDTSESPCDRVLADITVMGAVPAGKALRRDGARAGDRIFCTGSLGGARVELDALAAQRKPGESEPRSSARRTSSSSAVEHPHLYPQPRVTVGQALVRRSLATACIDLSDGLSTDLAHLCTASGVSAEIEAAKLPLHPLTRTLDAAATRLSAMDAALHGGEDYELLFTAPPDVLIPRAIAGVPVTRIGSIVRARREQPQITLIDPSGQRSALEPRGWEHFT